MEIKTMKRLDHPNVLKLLEVVDTPENLYMALEYCAGGEYLDFISRHEKVFIFKFEIE
jgi:serine/threonine protein kinase